MQRVGVLFLPLSLVTTSLTGCGLFGGSSTLGDALEVVPASADRVTFVDRVAIAERFEVDDVETGASRSEIDAYLETGREFPYGTALVRYLSIMEDAPFSDLDVVWEVTIGKGDEGSARVWRMRDDLDLDDAGDELLDLGFDEQDAGDDVRSLSIDPAEIDRDADPYLVILREVTIVPDEHLVISGPDAGDVLEVVQDDADSVVDADRFDDLVDGTDDVEVADLAGGDAACSVGERSLPPEQLKATGLEELGTPEERGFFVHGEDGETRAVLRFDDRRAAEDDADARRAFLDEGTSPLSGVPYSEFGDWEIEADGEQVRIDIDYDEPQTIAAVISRGDYPSVCLPPD